MAQLVSKYKPRSYFRPFHERNKRWALLVAHRRAGKTVAAINDLIEKATYNKRENPRYAYIAPLLRQAKDIAWKYLKEFSAPFRNKAPNESELYVELDLLPACPRITLYGADNPDSFRGLYLDGCVLDEFGNMRGSVWKEVLLPALIDRRGWAVFMGTPNGPNHFRDLWYEGLDDESYYTLFLPYTTTNIIREEDIAEMRKIMDEEQFAQEMMCSFEASVRGAIYARQMEQAALTGRIGDFPLQRGIATDVIMDLGHTDATTMGFVQRRPDGILMGHAHGDNLKPIKTYIRYIKDYWADNGLRPGQIWVPHDAKAKSLQTGKSIIENFREANLRPKLVPRLDILDGIAAVRATFPVLYINQKECKTLILALKSYHRKYDEEKKVYTDQPVHDWSSDWADMARYACIVENPEALKSDNTSRPRTGPRSEIVEATRQAVHYNFCLEDLWDLGPAPARRPYG